MINKKAKRLPIGKIIAVIVITLIVIGMLKPSLLFFLSEGQQEVIAKFQHTYFTSKMPVNASGKFDVMSLVAVVVIAAECWVIDTVIAQFARRVKMKSRHAETIKGLACNCLKYAVGIYGLIFGMSILGVNMVAVLASLGIMGLVVGFGAQSLIEDVITGLFIIFEGQFHVGDIVTIDNFRGTVTGIGIRTTQITDAGGNIKIVNNSDIRTLVNLSEVASVAIADIGISYSADLERAEAVIRDLLEQLPDMYPQIFKKVPTLIGVQDLLDSSVVLRVTAEVGENDVYGARRLLLRELKLTLDRNEIEIPFPQMVIHPGEY